MRYTHVAIGHPALQWEQLRKLEGVQLHLVNEIRTEQAAVFVLESEKEIGVSLASDLTALSGPGLAVSETPGLWLFFGNCDASRSRQPSISL
jgi:hypothetical protein